MCIYKTYNVHLCIKHTIITYMHICMNIIIYQDACSMHLSIKRNDTYANIIPIRSQTGVGGLCSAWRFTVTGVTRFANLVTCVSVYALIFLMMHQDSFYALPLQSLHGTEYLLLLTLTYIV